MSRTSTRACVIICWICGVWYSILTYIGYHLNYAESSPAFYIVFTILTLIFEFLIHVINIVTMIVLICRKCFLVYQMQQNEVPSDMLNLTSQMKIQFGVFMGFYTAYLLCFIMDITWSLLHTMNLVMPHNIPLSNLVEKEEYMAFRDVYLEVGLIVLTCTNSFIFILSSFIRTPIIDFIIAASQSFVLTCRRNATKYSILNIVSSQNLQSF